MSPENQIYPTPPEPPRLLFASERTARDLGKRADLVRVGRGVYLPQPPRGAPPWKARRQLTLARCAAALRAVPSAIALTHEAAAVVLGLASLRQEPGIRLATPASVSRRPYRFPALSVDGRPAAVVGLTRSLIAPAPGEVAVVSGLRVTTPLRTAMDCAFDLSVRESLPIIDSALRAVCRPDRRTRGATTPVPVAEARAQLAQMVEHQGPRRGAHRARVAVALADPLAESPGESVLRWAVAAAGLPDPVTQRPVAVDGRTYFLDLSLEEFVFDWEFDGLGKTATPEDLRAEKRRELALRRIGWDVQRFEWRELFAPERLARRMLGLVPVGAAAAARPRRDLWL